MHRALDAADFCCERIPAKRGVVGGTCSIDDSGNSNDHNHNSSRSSCVNDCSHCNNVDTCCCNDASNNDHDTGDDLHRLRQHTKSEGCHRHC